MIRSSGKDWNILHRLGVTADSKIRHDNKLGFANSGINVASESAAVTPIRPLGFVHNSSFRGHLLWFGT